MHQLIIKRMFSNQLVIKSQFYSPIGDLNFHMGIPSSCVWAGTFQRCLELRAFLYYFWITCTNYMIFFIIFVVQKGEQSKQASKGSGTYPACSKTGWAWPRPTYSGAEKLVHRNWQIYRWPWVFFTTNLSYYYLFNLCAHLF